MAKNLQCACRPRILSELYPVIFIIESKHFEDSYKSVTVRLTSLFQHFKLFGYIRHFWRCQRNAPWIYGVQKDRSENRCACRMLCKSVLCRLQWCKLRLIQIKFFFLLFCNMLQTSMSYNIRTRNDQQSERLQSIFHVKLQ